MVKMFLWYWQDDPPSLTIETCDRVLMIFLSKWIEAKWATRRPPRRATPRKAVSTGGNLWTLLNLVRLAQCSDISWQRFAGGQFCQLIEYIWSIWTEWAAARWLLVQIALVQEPHMYEVLSNITMTQWKFCQRLWSSLKGVSCTFLLAGRWTKG